MKMAGLRGGRKRACGGGGVHVGEVDVKVGVDDGEHDGQTADPVVRVVEDGAEFLRLQSSVSCCRHCCGRGSRERRRQALRGQASPLYEQSAHCCLWVVVGEGGAPVWGERCP